MNLSSLYPVSRLFIMCQCCHILISNIFVFTHCESLSKNWTVMTGIEPRPSDNTGIGTRSLGPESTIASLFPGILRIYLVQNFMILVIYILRHGKAKSQNMVFYYDIYKMYLIIWIWKGRVIFNLLFILFKTGFEG